MEDDKTNTNKYNSLMEEFPLLFREKDLPMNMTCMCWGIECGIGWYQPIYKLCCKLESLNEFFFKQHGFIVKADQVKEKMGTLHFYWSFDKAEPGKFGWTPELEEQWNRPRYIHLRDAVCDIVQKAVNTAEDECFRTCEHCGRTIGSIFSPRYETVGWISYICEDCLKKLQEKNPLTHAIKHFTRAELQRCEEYVTKDEYNKLIEELNNQKKTLP